jgi:hypothetical protein
MSQTSRRESRSIPPSLVKALSLTTGADDLLSSEGASMKRVRDRIDQFFTEASTAPEPQSIESAEDDSESQTTRPEHEHEVHLSVVAGVLEPKQGPQLERVDGVLLPTAHNMAQLDADKMRDSHALLNMFAALRNPAEDTHSKRRREKPSRKGDDDHSADVDAASSSSSECAFMNASSCSDDSDNEVQGRGKNQRQWVTELS